MDTPSDAPFYFITGGCRSGKSRFALCLAAQLGPPGVFIATAWGNDREMQERIARHKSERASSWQTCDITLDAAPGLAVSLPSTIGILPDPRQVILLDCLTLWVASCMETITSQEAMEKTASDLALALQKLSHPVVVVSNETGLGIVPEHPLARRFRDYAGVVNQIFARHAQHAILCVSGLPLVLKGSLPSASGRVTTTDILFSGKEEEPVLKEHTSLIFD